MKILCIGIAVMDILARPVSDKGGWQEKQRISDISIQPGGDALNQAMRLADLGEDVGIACVVGDDETGGMLIDAMKSRGVDTSLVCRDGREATSTSVILIGAEGERHIFSAGHAHALIDAGHIPAHLPEGCRAVSLGSLFSMPLLEKDGLLEALRTYRREGALVFADLASDKLHAGLAGVRDFLPEIDYFLPSLYDATAQTGCETAEEAARLYRELGVGCAVIKCGAKGAYYLSREEAGWAEALPVSPVDTTGAGDAMSAFFIARILAGDRPGEAAGRACRAASRTTLYLGASGGRITDLT